MFKSANQHPSGSEAASGLTGASTFSLESALDHPLSGYVILPVAGAALGAATHPLQAAINHLFYSPEERAQHPWKLRHSALLGAGVGLGRAIGHHLHQLHHHKHATWRPPVAARLFVEPLVKHSRAAKQGQQVRLGAWYVQGQDALPTDANYHRRGPGYKRRGHAAGQAQNLALLAKDANAPALSSLPHTMHPIANGQEIIHPVLFHGQLAPQQGAKPGPQLGPTAPNFTAPQHGKATVEGNIQSNNKLAGMGDGPGPATGRTVGVRPHTLLAGAVCHCRGQTMPG